MNSDSDIDVHTSVVHDDQEILLPDAESFFQASEGKRWTRIGAIALGGILILGVVAGIVVGVVGARHVAPYVSLVSPHTANSITRNQPDTTQPSTTTKPSTTAQPTTTAQPNTTAQPSTTTRPDTSKTAQPPTLSTLTKPPTTEPTVFIAAQFPPPTTHPMPKNPLDYPPVSLLIDMGMDPKFAEVLCSFTQPPVFKFNVTIADHTFTSPGANTKHLAKDAAAMVANEVIFGLKYPSVPVPTSKCTVVVPLK